MNILLVGSGGREHALAWKLKQSPRCSRLYCAPGNPGIAQVAELVSIPMEDIQGITDFAVQNKIDFVVVGPEAPLVAGLADLLRAKNISVFGPSKKAAQLEGSKGFMKDLCRKYNIPTAAYERFTDVDKALAFIDQHGAPIVVKADGLAAGKGVVVAENIEQAKEAVRDMLSGNAFGDAGHSIVIEEFLDGEEVSYFVLADGKNILPLSSAQDHKRVGDGDTGPNTGGMGAYSPAPIFTKEMEDRVLREMIQPTVDGMAKEGCAFTGIFFAGLMIVKGVPKLLEYNARFGDPECQMLMMRFQGDLVDLLYAAAVGKLDTMKDKISWSDQPALGVVMASKGYPGAYIKNTLIKDIDKAEAQPQVRVFHAGTALDKSGNLVNAGGRVLTVCAMGADIQTAQKNAYQGLAQINWPDSIYRSDIGWRAIALNSPEKKKASTSF